MHIIAIVFNILLYFFCFCIGCILLSEKVEKNKDDNIENEYGNDFSLGGLDIEITRNYYGSQVKF